MIPPLLNLRVLSLYEAVEAQPGEMSEIAEAEVGTIFTLPQLQEPSLHCSLLLKYR